MSCRFLITAAAVTVVGSMSLGQLGLDEPSQQQQTAQPAAGQVGGQTGQTGQMGMTGQQQISDRDFVRQAASAGQFEVKSAKLVQDKADDPQIKQHARRIEQDHERANQELKQIAKNKNIELTEDMDARHQRLYDQLKDQDKEQLVQTWKQQMQQAHRENIQLFQRASTQLQDPELKQFAQKQLPILQQHQAMLQGDRSAQPAGAQLGQDQDKEKDQDKPDMDSPMQVNP